MKEEETNGEGGRRSKNKVKDINYEKQIVNV